MPYSRPGYMKYVTATKAVLHGALATESQFVGVAVKQKAPSAGAGSGTPQKQIEIGEAFALISKGEVQVAAVGGIVKGDPVYINATNNAVTEADPGAGNGRKVGRCTAVAGERGTPTGFMRVDLDAKDTLAQPA